MDVALLQLIYVWELLLWSARHLSEGSTPAHHKPLIRQGSHFQWPTPAAPSSWLVEQAKLTTEAPHGQPLFAKPLQQGQVATECSTCTSPFDPLDAPLSRAQAKALRCPPLVPPPPPPPPPPPHHNDIVKHISRATPEDNSFDTVMARPAHASGEASLKKQEEEGETTLSLVVHVDPSVSLSVMCM